MALTLSTLCKSAENTYDLKLVAGRDGLENTVRWVHMVEDTEVPDFLHGNELVFTTGIANYQANWLLYFVKNLKKNNAAGLVINLGPYIESIPPQVIVYCEQNSFPIFTIPWETRIIDISYKFCRLIINDEKQDQSVTEAFKNLILEPDDKKGYSSTLERAGFLEDSRYAVIVVEFMRDGTNATVNLLREHDTTLSKILRINSYKKASFIWNKKLVLIYQNINFSTIDLMVEKIKSMCCENENVYFGISNFEKNCYSISELYTNAQSAFKVSLAQKKTMLRYEDIGVCKILLDVKKQQVLKSYFNENLGSLVAYDKEHNSDLCKTLRLYFENNGSVNEMAEFSGVHRNTVNYKMKKIKEILGIELNYKNIMDIMLSFTISDILN